MARFGIIFFLACGGVLLGFGAYLLFAGLGARASGAFASAGFSFAVAFLTNQELARAAKRRMTRDGESK